jgi:hypothetical protein
MSKAIVRVGYEDYIVDADKALAIVEALANAERYEMKYYRAEGDVAAYHTHHVYDMDTDKKFHIEVLSNKFYLLCKMAGKPVG